MRIESDPGTVIPSVHLWLSRNEAAEVRDRLDEMLAQEDPPGTWHAHVSSADFRSELSISAEGGVRVP
ncbi:hypothetical protein OEB99_04835 [Actinotalea sp. M2MS4P-6]|uniref:hypothetical protein n=1 Tax=Actinotalea sp. M2MS4P-6 TaxID=2983762 RepID=UPI0021E40CC4|nr:hypothetical protein [Actinotalea sp. M2MS4P-6]MCV2393627.1 hypothetical protein [Actinotalea sp. M2MS4P-6]